MIFYVRLALLLVMFLFVVGGGVSVFFLQCTEQIHAGNRRKIYITS